MGISEVNNFVATQPAIVAGIIFVVGIAVYFLVNRKSSTAAVPTTGKAATPAKNETSAVSKDAPAATSAATVGKTEALKAEQVKADETDEQKAKDAIDTWDAEPHQVANSTLETAAAALKEVKNADTPDAPQHVKDAAAAVSKAIRDSLEATHAMATKAATGKIGEGKGD